MFSLSDLLGEQQGNETLGQISSAIGADTGATGSAIQMALPMILGSLANNASTPEGAQSLNNALEQDHSGGLLQNIGGLIMGQLGSSRETDGGGILGHILGSKRGQATEAISNHSGLSGGQVMQLLMMLAPIVMSYLGKKKQDEGLDAGGLAGYLGGQQQQMQQQDSGGIMGAVTGMLDADKDGSSLDDLASMAFNYFTKK